MMDVTETGSDTLSGTGKLVVTGSMSASELDTFTTSLLHFNGANGSTSFVDDKGLSYSSVGGAALTTTGPKFGTASLALNGTTQYIEAADNAAFKIGGGNFTIEAWIYLSSVPTSGAFAPIAAHGNSVTTGTYFFAVSSASALHFSFGAAGTTVAGGSISLNTWTHVAVVQGGGNISLYVNGTSVASSGVSLATFASGVFRIGRGRAASSNYFNGRIDEFRLTKGLARYTTSFTAPTEPFNLGVDSALGQGDVYVSGSMAVTEIDPNIIALLHFDGTTPVDETGKVWTTSGTASLSADYNKFGGKSLKNVNTGYITCSHPNFAVRREPFTIEMFVKIMGSPSEGYSYNFAQLGTSLDCEDGFGLTYNNQNGGIEYFNARLEYYVGVGVYNDYTSVSKPLDWIHVALMRDANDKFTFAENGIISSQVTKIRDITTNVLKIGYGSTSWNDTSRTIYLDEVKFTRGVNKYTSNFTPPTAAFVNASDIASGSGKTNFLWFGTSQVTKAYLGTTPLSKLYLGTTQVF
jgi:hypothetical protein